MTIIKHFIEVLWGVSAALNDHQLICFRYRVISRTLHLFKIFQGTQSADYPLFLLYPESLIWQK